MSSFWNYLFAGALIIIWIIAGGFITQTNVILGKKSGIPGYTNVKWKDISDQPCSQNLSTDTGGNARLADNGNFSEAYKYSFWAAFTTWTLVGIFIILIILAVCGIVALFGTGAGEAGVAAEEMSAEERVARNALRGKTAPKKPSGLTIAFLVFSLILVIITGILSALTASKIQNDCLFSNPQAKGAPTYQNKDIAKALHNAIVAASMCLAAAGLLIIGIITYFIIRERENTKYEREEKKFEEQQKQKRDEILKKKQEREDELEQQRQARQEEIQEQREIQKEQFQEQLDERRAQIEEQKAARQQRLQEQLNGSTTSLSATSSPITNTAASTASPTTTPATNNITTATPKSSSVGQTAAIVAGTTAVAGIAGAATVAGVDANKKKVNGTVQSKPSDINNSSNKTTTNKTANKTADNTSKKSSKSSKPVSTAPEDVTKNPIHNANSTDELTANSKATTNTNNKPKTSKTTTSKSKTLSTAPDDVKQNPIHNTTSSTSSSKSSTSSSKSSTGSSKSSTGSSKSTSSSKSSTGSSKSSTSSSKSSTSSSKPSASSSKSSTSSSKPSTSSSKPSSSSSKSSTSTSKGTTSTSK